MVFFPQKVEYSFGYHFLFIFASNELDTVGYVSEANHVGMYLQSCWIRSHCNIFNFERLIFDKYKV